ncbi:MAG: glycosyltransferase family 2 protein [Muribaculaceae bacterium]|nr:glycosyltransferase family 2 protein [Muribaculaceae bacterium]
MTKEENRNRCMTIVVPVFNRETLIERSLDSLYAQTWRPIHLIVVDNASSDASAERAARWGERHSDDNFSFRLLSDTRHGAAYARETGLEHTSTDYVMFFDSDDVMHPDTVQTAMDIFLSDSSVDMVTWPVAFLREKGTRISHKIEGRLMERHLVHSVLRTEGYAVRTEFLRRAGGWKGEFPNWNDFETGVRLILRDPEIRIVDRPMSDVYPQVVSITGVDYVSKAGKWEKSLDAAEAYIAASTRTDRRRLLNIVNWRRAMLAALYAREGRADLAAPLLRLALEKTDKKRRPVMRLSYLLARMGMRGTFTLFGWLF